LDPKIVDWPRYRESRIHKPPLPIKRREDREVSSEDLIDSLSRLAETLMCQINMELDYRDILIKTIRGWEESVEGKKIDKFAALLKEVDLRKISKAALDLTHVVRFIDNRRSGRKHNGLARER
jgi:hypothetical protein